MAEHNETGTSGERQAQTFLRKKGYTIRHINWRTRHGELDIVAEKDNQLVVVEVKTRSTENFEHPQEAITNQKIKKIVNTTQAYIEQFNIEMETRFDVVSVITKENGYVVEHIEDAFLAPVN